MIRDLSLDVWGLTRPIRFIVLGSISTLSLLSFLQKTSLTVFPGITSSTLIWIALKNMGKSSIKDHIGYKPV